MKNLRLLFCALLTLILTAAGARAQAPDAEAMRADVEARTRAFYSFYCHALDSSPGPMDDLSKLKPYVSARFLKEIDRLGKQEGGLEADPFVLAQDTDPDWSKKVKVANAKAAADGKTGTADVTLGASQKDMVRYLRVSLVNEGGVYKVDKVKDLHP